ncbi:hypothetical protein JCM8547_005145 [Rhodosporidiobolus lusitaniae]
MPAAVDRSGIKQLVALRDELSTAIDRISQSEDPLPALSSLDLPFLPPSPAVLEATTVTRELLALLLGVTAPLDKTMGFHLSSALRVVIEAHVVETLREAKEGKKDGLHVEEIAKSSNIDPAKLARILRLLAAHWIFVEKEPDVFTLNRPALFLDTGKSVEELNSTKDWYTGTNGFAALVAHTVDDVMKGSAILTETLLDKETGHSYKPEHAASVRGTGMQEPIWAYWAQPGNKHLAARFGAAMLATRLFAGEGLGFQDLPKNATLVDVGSGVGSAALLIAKSAPQIKLVLQDRPEVIIGEAQKVWQKEAPEDINSGRVQLTVHDFFKPQPVKNADVYFLRAVIHDWPDDLAIPILRHLRDAASRSSKLILMEQPIDHIPPSGRVANLNPYSIDQQMLVAINAMERTAEQYAALALKAGWQIKKVWKTGPNGTEGGFRHYEFAPAE